jgi:hypothetical protein
MRGNCRFSPHTPTAALAVGMQLFAPIFQARFILIKQISNTTFCSPLLVFTFMWLTLLRIYACHVGVHLTIGYTIGLLDNYVN